MKSDEPERKVVSNGKLTVPLYHGTSTLFHQSILQTGLGGRSIVEDLKLRSINRTLEEICNAKLGPDDSDWITDIVSYANGLAAVCHDLCLKICQAIGVVETLDQMITASDKHLESAVQGYLREMEDTVKAAFDRALRKDGRGRYHNTELIIRALAESPLDGATEEQLLHRIREREQGYRLVNLKKFLQELQTEQRGSLLRSDNASGRYSFRDPLFRTVARLREPRETVPSAASFERLMRAMIKDLGWQDFIRVTIARG